MYHIHTTSAFVLNVLPSGEKHHFITLFTKEFGMIRARAQSVRVFDSKLRYALQEYSYVEVSLVKGKEVWRITNALPIYNIYFELRDKQDVFMVIARVFSVIKRLVPEEGSERALFKDIEDLCNGARLNSFKKENIETLEWFSMLRMMYFLGYSHKELFKDLCGDDVSWTNEYLQSIIPHKSSAIISINQALKASHL